MRFHFDFKDLDLDDIVRISRHPDIRARVKNHWPLIDPHNYEKWVKFEDQYIPFDVAKAIIEFCG
jgi:hypothetical protein